MEENYISFHTSKLLYSLDRDAFVIPQYYNEEGKPYTVSLVVRRLTQNNNTYYPRIRQSLLHKWLRERHDIHVIPYVMTTDSKKYGVESVMAKSGDRIYVSDSHFSRYEDALEIGLQESMNYILSKE